MGDEKPFSSFCCNPFKKPKHRVKTNLRNVTDWMSNLQSFNIENGMKICDSCRKALPKEDSSSNLSGKTEENSAAEEETRMLCNSDSDSAGAHDSGFHANDSVINDSALFIDQDLPIDHLNSTLSILGESPVIKKRIRTSSYCLEKSEKIKQKIVETVLVGASHNEKNDGAEIIQQLKDKFNQTEKRSEKIQILTILPKSLSSKKIQDEFGVSHRTALIVKKLAEEKGILSTPNITSGNKKSSEEVIKLVEDFYNDDEVSRMMPGKKDFVSVKGKDNVRTHVQKRLILGNLKEIYEVFKTKYPTEKIGFSKFAELPPKNCILAGGSGTHTVCVCTVHQNVKLMMNAAKIEELILEGRTEPIKHYRSLLRELTCDLVTPNCHLNKCKECPSTDDLKEKLLKIFEEEMIDNITYKQWVQVDHCSFETITKSAEDFAETFCEKLKVLKCHDFIAKKQALFYRNIKENLKRNELLIILDFSENYSFVLQDEVQSYHWNNLMATLHPMIVYFKIGNDLKHQSFVCISDCLKHDTMLVHLFQKKLINLLKEMNLVEEIKKIYYFSDNCGSQYKNKKNFKNLCYHLEDFGCDAEWNFFAAAHGKGVCDGVGGTVERLAARASLQRPYKDQIMTPKQLYDWAKANIKATTFIYCTDDEYASEVSLMESRYRHTKTLVGTQQFHSFKPLSTTLIAVKTHSYSETEEKKEIL